MAAVSPALIKFNFLKQNDFEECFSFECVSVCVHTLLGTVQISQCQSNELFHMIL